ncbi:hypothetical protein VM1G_10213 [Cytospora mali]|uniref:Uncharacterized protein n=1 Tax=Cytospora mali TaxID=578113 RepID=A0A194VHA1_CYTMA|nr:hypothetical protein VM1G_10213 [Valsa mali]
MNRGIYENRGYYDDEFDTQIASDLIRPEKHQYPLVCLGPKPKDTSERMTSITERTPMNNNSHNYELHTKYSPPPLPSRRSSLNPDQVHESGRPRQRAHAPQYPGYFDDEPYNPQPDSSVHEQINALLLEWTPSNPTETPEDTTKESKDDQVDDTEDNDENIGDEVGELQGEPSEEKRRRPKFKTRKSVDFVITEDPEWARKGHLNLDSDRYSDGPESYARMFDQGDRSKPTSPQLHQATVEAVSDEALEENKSPGASSPSKVDETPSLQNKGKQPARPYSFPTATGAPNVNHDWARRLVEATQAPSEQTHSPRQPQGPTLNSVGWPGPRPRPSTYAYKRPGSTRQQSIESSPAGVFAGGRADRGFKGTTGTASDIRPQLRRSGGSEQLHKSVTF